MSKIDIGKDFSEITGGRFRNDIMWSAEELRDDVIIPKLGRTNGELVINMGDQDGYLPSFLEEAFGGLVRKVGPETASRVRIISSEFNKPKKEMAEEFIQAAIERVRWSPCPQCTGVGCPVCGGRGEVDWNKERKL